jgi:hypothetical protein
MARRANDHFVDKAVIFSILFAAAMRDDTAYIAQSEWWSDLQRHFVVSFLKEYSIIILWLASLLIVFGVLSRRQFLVYLTPGPLIFLMGVLYAGCRGLIEDSELGGKVFIGFLFYTVVIFYCFNIIFNDCTSNFVKNTCIFCALFFKFSCRNQRIQFAHRQRVCAWKPQIVRNCGGSESYGGPIRARRKSIIV